jgi:hypothetical protein
MKFVLRVLWTLRPPILGESLASVKRACSILRRGPHPAQPCTAENATELKTILAGAPFILRSVRRCEELALLPRRLPRMVTVLCG